MRTLTISLIGAIAAAAGIVLIRQQKESTPADAMDEIPPSETTLNHRGQIPVSLDRLRELGL